MLPVNVAMAEEEAKKTETGAKPRTPTENTQKPTRRMEALAKKATKKNAKLEQKDKRNLENILRAIVQFSPEEKYKILCDKYKSLYEEVSYRIIFSVVTDN